MRFCLAAAATMAGLDILMPETGTPLPQVQKKIPDGRGPAGMRDDAEEPQP